MKCLLYDAHIEERLNRPFVANAVGFFNRSSILSQMIPFWRTSVCRKNNVRHIYVINFPDLIFDVHTLFFVLIFVIWKFFSRGFYALKHVMLLVFFYLLSCFVFTQWCRIRSMSVQSSCSVGNSRVCICDTYITLTVFLTDNWRWAGYVHEFLKNNLIYHTAKLTFHLEY